MTIDRRRLLAGVPAAMAGTALFAGATTACATPDSGKGSGVDGPQVHWRMMVSWPKDLSIMYGGAQFVADRVKAMTGGRFTIDLHVEGELDTKDDLMTAVSKGFVECGHSSSDYYADKNAGLTFGSGAPFGLTAAEHASWLRFGGGMELIGGLYDQFGIVYFPAGNTGAQMGGWFNKEIKSTDDLKGLRMRIGGIGAEVMKTFGVTPVDVPYLKLAGAIKSGQLDAAEFVAPFDDAELGLNKVAKFYYSPGWWQIGDQLDFIVNKKAFHDLPAEYQQIVESAAWEANQRVVAEYDAKNGNALTDLVKGGTQLREFPIDMMRTAFAVMEGIHVRESAKSADYKRVFESWNAYRWMVKKWHVFIESPVMRSNVFTDPPPLQ
ncbi:TRAP transporter substrate-binding protein DctP [Mycobacterium sp. 852013-50091_SCH5140682]|uniref:TRAP transporter substrate-binding protein n=1 Tax=Mycobacterium sp. 852013-50091_SCH5140682 TaxID=1834109 RepID=UPI000A608A59|nr:TRAP transporter substrate-binding protein DctP [Mycobacterium sp. 852013-50091_SCH5140682]